MARNVLVYCGPAGAADLVVGWAALAGGGIGLVATARDPAELRASGGRIEQDREWGGRVLSAFDEPLAVGTAVAQLAGHAEAVVVDRLDEWAARLAAHHAGDAESIDAELTALRSVMAAQLVDLYLLAQPAGDGPAAAAALHRRVLAEVEPLCDTVVEVSGGSARVRRGGLPG